VDKIAEALNIHKKPLNGSQILVCGIAYKRNIDDIRESPALDVMGLLHERGARLSYSDPFVPVLAAKHWPGKSELRSTRLTPAMLADVDCVVIVTDHEQVDFEELVAAAPLVVDTRNAVKKLYPHVFRLGAPQPAHAAVWSTSNVSARSLA